eukprot:jgi/Botrbrau1/6627/Bobra.104_2s0014.1
MGSLMPGWEKRAPGVPPKGFEEAEDYIGQHSRLKLERSLSRHSADSRSSLSPRTPDGAKSGRFVMSSGIHGEARGPQARESLTRHSVGPIMEAASDSTEDKEGKSAHGHERWWNKFDSSFLNRAIDAQPEDYRKGTYVPQHDVAHVHAGTAPATCTAQNSKGLMPF